MSSDSDAVQSGASQRSTHADKHGRVPKIRDPLSELFRVGIRVPPFWAEKPSIWFAQIEAQFCIARITDDNTKFYYVLSHLDGKYSATVEDIIANPPATGKFDKLKTELIKRLSLSRQKKVKQLLQSEELGDRKPSQFLRHLQQLAGPNMPDDFITDVWTSRLPHNLQAIIASQSNLSLQELADLADRVHDIAPASPLVAAVSTTKLEAAIDIMARQITELTKQVSALATAGHDRARSRQRETSLQRSRTPTHRTSSNYRKFPACWYHFKFGSQAKKCITPCDYTAGNARGSR